MLAFIIASLPITYIVYLIVTMIRTEVPGKGMGASAAYIFTPKPLSSEYYETRSRHARAKIPYLTRKECGLLTSHSYSFGLFVISDLFNICALIVLILAAINKDVSPVMILFFTGVFTFTVLPVLARANKHKLGYMEVRGPNVRRKEKKY